MIEKNDFVDFMCGCVCPFFSQSVTFVNAWSYPSIRLSIPVGFLRDFVDFVEGSRTV